MNQAEYLSNVCPNCGQKTLDWADEADVGVGILRSPAWCDSCGYSEDTGLVEPDMRVPTNAVPNEHDLALTWAAVPVPPTPNERQLEDDLHDAINPPSPDLNVGLARIGAQRQVERIMEVLRQRGLIHG